VKACGTITFDWRVFPDEDGDATWTYQGPTPKVDESKYPLYAVLNEDSRFIDSPALGMALPRACQVKSLPAAIPPCAFYWNRKEMVFDSRGPMLTD